MRASIKQMENPSLVGNSHPSGKRTKLELIVTVLQRHIAAAFLIGGAVTASISNPAIAIDKDAHAYNRVLGRGINLGNALEAPREGSWGVTLQASYFEAIKEAGFDSVRIPIRWSAHAMTEPPYEINPVFFKRVDWAIEQALSRKLAAVINVHHYDEMDRDPVRNLPRLLALWKQIALRYRDWPDNLFFELFNEPHDGLNDERWQDTFPQLMRAIRESNPNRMLIVGPAWWNSLDHLSKLHLPEHDRRVIVTFHYYQPFKFTHQGAGWVKDSSAWRGTKWTGTVQEREDLRKDFEKAAAWARENRRPLYVGEFGAYQDADMESRALWTGAVAREADRLGFSWSYWEFCYLFGAYDPVQRSWRQPLLRALLDKN